MPKVTVEFTDAEKEALNAEGRARGVADCPECRNSLFWATGHETVYGEGPTGAVPGAPPAVGLLGVTVLCEWCWQRLKPEQRVRHYERHLRAWGADVRSVKKVRKPDGTLGDDPEDKARHDAEQQRWGALRKTVLDAVRAGG